MSRFILLFMIVSATRAYADDHCTSAASPENQAASNALYKEGNELFSQQAHARAVEKFKAAVALWDEPRIRFNLAVAEIQIDHILEAAEDLDAALRCGPSPFSADQYRQALSYQKLLRGRVGTLEASCKQAGGSVLLDGKPWFSCPHTQTLKVLAGEHLVVAEAKGYMTISRRVVVAGGKTSSEQLALLPIESVTKLVYPSPRWLPWSTAGVGVALGLAGGAVWYSARDDMRDFERRFESVCTPMCGKDLDATIEQQLLAKQRDDAQFKGKVGVAMMAAGGTVAAVGIVWVILNRPERVVPKLEAAPTSGGFAARASWRF